MYLVYLCICVSLCYRCCQRYNAAHFQGKAILAVNGDHLTIASQELIQCRGNTFLPTGVQPQVMYQYQQQPLQPGQLQYVQAQPQSQYIQGQPQPQYVEGQIQQQILPQAQYVSGQLQQQAQEHSGQYQYPIQCVQQQHYPQNQYQPQEQPTTQQQHQLPPQPPLQYAQVPPEPPQYSEPTAPAPPGEKTPSLASVSLHPQPLLMNDSYACTSSYLLLLLAVMITSSISTIVSVSCFVQLWSMLPQNMWKKICQSNLCNRSKNRSTMWGVILSLRLRLLAREKEG